MHRAAFTFASLRADFELERIVLWSSEGDGSTQRKHRKGKPAQRFQAAPRVSIERELVLVCSRPVVLAALVG